MYAPRARNRRARGITPTSIASRWSTTLRCSSGSKHRQADLLNVIADQYDVVIPQEIAAKGDAAIASLADVVGSGPYQLTAYEPGQRAQLKRRADGYWRPSTAWLDEWDLLDIEDPGVAANMLLARYGRRSGLPARARAHIRWQRRLPGAAHTFGGTRVPAHQPQRAEVERRARAAGGVASNRPQAALCGGVPGRRHAWRTNVSRRAGVGTERNGIERAPGFRRPREPS